MLGRLVHYLADLAIVSVLLAGVRRNSGLAPNTELLGDGEPKRYVDKYLLFGEWGYDTTVGLMGTTSWFVRK